MLAAETDMNYIKSHGTYQKILSARSPRHFEKCRMKPEAALSQGPENTKLDTSFPLTCRQERNPVRRQRRALPADVQLVHLLRNPAADVLQRR